MNISEASESQQGQSCSMTIKSEYVKAKRNDFPFELCKDYKSGNRLSRSAIIEKNKNHINFKVIKNKDTDMLKEDLTEFNKDEKDKELEKLLDNFMSRKCSFKKNYLDILICNRHLTQPLRKR
jgi:hypothetical protein